MLEGVSESDKYRMFVESLQSCTAYSYVQTYEREHPGVHNFGGLIEVIRAIQPASTVETKLLIEYDALKMEAFTEAAYIEFDRKFVDLAARIGSKSDSTKRTEYFKKIHV